LMVSLGIWGRKSRQPPWNRTRSALGLKVGEMDTLSTRMYSARAPILHQTGHTCKKVPLAGDNQPPNGLELRNPAVLAGSCPAEAGSSPPILARAGGPGAPPYHPARRVSFAALLGGRKVQSGALPDAFRRKDLRKSECFLTSPRTSRIRYFPHLPS